MRRLRAGGPDQVGSMPTTEFPTAQAKSSASTRMGVDPVVLHLHVGLIERLVALGGRGILFAQPLLGRHRVEGRLQGAHGDERLAHLDLFAHRGLDVPGRSGRGIGGGRGRIRRPVVRRAGGRPRARGRRRAAPAAGGRAAGAARCPRQSAPALRPLGGRAFMSGPPAAAPRTSACEHFGLTRCGTGSPRTAAMALSAASSAMRPRVSTVALPRWGRSVTLGRSGQTGRQLGLPLVDVEAGAPPGGRSCSASTRAASSTTGPRAVLTRYDPGRMSASSRAPMRCRVSGSSGTCRLTMSASRSRSSSPARNSQRAARTASGPPAAARSSSCRPPACPSRGPAGPPPARCAPCPRCPGSRPATARPSSMNGLQRSKRPSRTIRSPSTTRRTVLRIRAQVRSAVASVSTPGVLVTRMPRAVAAATSMLSTPTAMLEMTRSRGPARP